MPVIIPGITFPDLATPPPNTALGSSGAKYSDYFGSGNVWALGHSSFGADASIDQTYFGTPSTQLVNARETITSVSAGQQSFALYGTLSLDLSADSDGSFYGNLGEMYVFGSHDISGGVWGQSAFVEHSGTGTIAQLIGMGSGLAVDTGATVTQVVNLYGAPISVSGAASSVSQLWLDVINVSGAVPVSYGIFVEDQTGGATNVYYEWFNSQGVRRVKHDSTFDSVHQAIEALYNPQFTKYTPGAVNFERVVLGQWNGNIAEIGTEAGGTGVLRAVKIIGASLNTPATLTANGVAVATASSATAFTNKSGNISQWTNDSGYLTTVGGSSGTGNLVRVTGATLVTPTLGAALATSLNGNTFTTGTYALTGAASKTLTFSNSLTLAGTDSTTMTFPTTSATIARTDAANTFTGTQTFAGTLLAADGTSSLPAFSFSGNSAIGMFRDSNGDVVLNGGLTTRLLYIGGRSGTALAGVFCETSSSGIANALGMGTSSSTLFFGTPGGTPVDINAQSIRLGTSLPGDAIMTRSAVATIQYGFDVNGSAPAQTIQSCRGITGADKTGAPFHFIAGPGTGAATVSYIDFITPTVTTSGATQQIGVVRATISSAGLNTTVPIAFGGNLAISNAVPTISSGFGSGATIAGIAGGFRITCGTAPGVGGTVAFNATYANAPVCFVQDETTGILGIAAPTTTIVVISGLTLLAGQTVAVFVFGY